MRLELGPLICRCLPLGIVATVWVVAKAASIPPDHMDRRWFIAADGKLSLAQTKMVHPPLTEPLTREAWPGPALADAR